MGCVSVILFFSTEIAALKGEEEKKGKTSEQIKALMQQIIEDEDKCSPFSDKNIMEKLLEMGVSISRRTVAKYRDSMGIADALGRKQF